MAARLLLGMAHAVWTFSRDRHLLVTESDPRTEPQNGSVVWPPNCWEVAPRRVGAENALSPWGRETVAQVMGEKHSWYWTLDMGIPLEEET